MIPDDLVDGIRKGDHDAFSQVHALVRPELLKFVQPRIRDWYLAEDIVSETFVQLWRYHSTIYGNGLMLMSWLHQTAFRQILRHVTTRSRRVEEELGDVPERVFITDSPARTAMSEEEAKVVHRYLRKLTPKQEYVMRLRLAGVGNTEIARRVGTTERAIQQLHVRARRQLRMLYSNAPAT